ncbi:m7GpppX diphosphatase [Neodiprion pinetum]|uniref:m7GpppX diphosphatase n=1 Tax=Neodiprion lecontei TaxID=441921 RepID=A0A6J0BRR3_NEOLC|nr:m7GpppX diphosphatase [Neodiprion lecontei]XP_046490517.1 m7GpppX diphosphatase [Neodiprion pinetum]
MASVEKASDEATYVNPKKFKSSNEEPKESKKYSVHESLKDLSKFQLKRVLNNNAQKKLLCVEGTFADHDGAAIVLLEKKAFVEEKLDEHLFNESSKLSKEFENDVYGNYNCFPSIEHNSIKTTIIHPAMEKHIAKFENQPIHIVEETPKLYEEITLPHLKKEQFSLQWVYNILEHKAEKERIVFEDPDPKTGFVLIPDLKWDGSLETLYLLAIPMLKGIKSIRDLDQSHLPLLKNIRDAGTKAISKKYSGLPASQLRIYFHYQPSFYHLHIHFTYLKYDAPGIFTEKAHLLSTVINNIELMGEYYSKATLSFVVKESETLFSKYQAHGVLSSQSVEKK